MLTGEVKMDAKFKELTQLIRNGDLARLASETKKGDFDINHQDENGYTLLHVATKRNNQEAILVLLQCHDIDPNVKNKNGNTPLFEAVKYVKAKALEALLTSERLDLEEEDSEYKTIDDYVTEVRVGEDTKNYMRNMIRRRRNAEDGADTSGRHAIVIANSNYSPESKWEPLDGPLTDRDLLLQMFKENHYIVHEVIDTEDVLVSVREVMEKLDRSTLKLVHLAYSGGLLLISLTLCDFRSWWSQNRSGGGVSTKGSQHRLGGDVHRDDRQADFSDECDPGSHWRHSRRYRRLQGGHPLHLPVRHVPHADQGGDHFQDQRQELCHQTRIGEDGSFQKSLPDLRRSGRSGRAGRRIPCATDRTLPEGEQLDQRSSQVRLIT